MLIFAKFLTTSLVVSGIILLALIIFIFSAIKSTKNKKHEEMTRKSVIREEIKKYINSEEKEKNINLEFKSINKKKSFNSKEKNDLYYVVVTFIEPKTNNEYANKAYEVEAKSEKIGSRKYLTKWKVKSQVELELAEKNNLMQNKTKTLTKGEKQKIKDEEMLKRREYIANLENQYKTRNFEKTKTSKETDGNDFKQDKFLPKRSKKREQ